MRDSVKRRVGYTHYSSAEAFAPRWLDKYIERQVSRGGGYAGGYSGGYGGSVPSFSGSLTFIEFDTDGTSSSGNLVSPLNSILDQVGSPGNWLGWTLGSSPQIKFKRGGLYMVNYQAQIEGADAGVRLMCTASFLSASVGSGPCFGGSVPNENDDTISYINMSSVFEMPNHLGFSVGTFVDYLPYVKSKTASGTHNFDTVFSSLKLTKLA